MGTFGRDDGDVELAIDSELNAAMGLHRRINACPTISGTVKNPSQLLDTAYSLDNGIFVSDEFRTAMSELADKDVQYFPVELTGPDGRIARRYWLMNLLRCIDCIDYEVTEKTLMPTRAGGYLSIFVRSASIPSDADFHGIKDHPGRMFVSDRVRRAIRRTKLRGIGLDAQACTDVKQGMIERRSEFLELLFNIPKPKGLKGVGPALDHLEKCRQFGREIAMTPDAG